MSLPLAHRIARRLRALAERLDGQEFIPERWNKTNVVGMNRYIGVTERYIRALEDLILALADSNAAAQPGICGGAVAAEKVIQDLRERFKLSQRVTDFIDCWPPVEERPIQ